MTRVTDDIRKPHSPRQSLPNFSNRNEVAELAECLLGLPSFSSELLLSKGHFLGCRYKLSPQQLEKWNEKKMRLYDCSKHTGLKKKKHLTIRLTTWFPHCCTKLSCVLSLVIICHSALGDRLSQGDTLGPV